MNSDRGKILFSFCVAIGVLCAVALSIYSNFAQMNRQKERVEHTYAVISALQELLSNLKDVQSSQRGYIITGLEDYLSPYYIALPKIDDQTKEIAGMISDNPEQLEHMKNLRDHIVDRLNTSENIIEAYQKQGQDVAMDMVRQGSGKREMDEIRIIVAEMVAREQNLLTQRRTSVENYFNITMYAAVSGLLVCIAILSAVFMMMSREAANRIKTEENLRDAVDEMARTNTETKTISLMGDYLRSAREQEEAYEMIARNMPEIFPQSYGSVSIFNNSRNILHPVLQWGEIPENAKLEFEPEDCWALRQGRAHMNNGEGTVPTCLHLEGVADGNMTICLPMQAQGETIGQIFIGASKAKRHEATRNELGTMRRVTEQISLALANLNLQRALKEQSIKDPLTKLYNRRYLEETLARECSRAQRNSQPLTVLLMDIDFFKKVNDTYGHDAGDAVLVSFAKMLSTKCRKEDIACRWGGEEFVLVLGAADSALAQSRAQEICDSTRAMKINFQGKTIPVTVSIGAAVFPEHGETTEELIRNADQCLYKAKQGGRDRVVMYTASA